MRSLSPACDTIDAYVEAQMRRLKIPGASLAIVEGDKIVHLRGFGRARQGNEVPTPQTPFFIGSVTKSFTALAARLDAVFHARLFPGSPTSAVDSPPFGLCCARRWSSGANARPPSRSPFFGWLRAKQGG